MARASLIPDVIDAIVAGLRATSGFRAPNATTDGITVFDGPEFLGVRSPMPEGFVVIGYGGEDLEDRDDTSTTEGVTGAQGPIVMARSTEPRTADDDLSCVAYYSGDDDVSATRRAAYDIADRVDTWLRDNDAAGITPTSDGFVTYARVTLTSSRQERFDGGCSVTVRFAINVRSRT